MILAAIPAYNEETALGSVVLRARKFVDRVVVVDDGSTDGTAEIARLAGAVVISHGCNRGYGAAIQSCLAVAKSEGADALVILDGDGQHDPAEIPALLDPVVNGGYDLVIGSRFLRPSADIPLYRRLGIRLLTGFTNLSEEQKVSDSQSGFRAYSGKAISLLKGRGVGMGIGSELVISARELGLSLKEVPIGCRYGDLEGSTHHPLVHGASVFYAILSIIKEKRPLLFFGTSGTAFLVVGLVLGWQSTEIYYTTGGFPVGKALLAALCIIVAIVAIFSALVLDSISALLKANR
jgi:glycosyltransferase involved in cell wall biosynthesis